MSALEHYTDLAAEALAATTWTNEQTGEIYCHAHAGNYLISGITARPRAKSHTTPLGRWVLLTAEEEALWRTELGVDILCDTCRSEQSLIAQVQAVFPNATENWAGRPDPDSAIIYYGDPEKVICITHWEDPSHYDLWVYRSREAWEEAHSDSVETEYAPTTIAECVALVQQITEAA